MELDTGEILFLTRSLGRYIYFKNTLPSTSSILESAPYRPLQGYRISVILHANEYEFSLLFIYKAKITEYYIREDLFYYCAPVT